MDYPKRVRIASHYLVDALALTTTALHSAEQDDVDTTALSEMCCFSRASSEKLALLKYSVCRQASKYARLDHVADAAWACYLSQMMSAYGPHTYYQRGNDTRATAV